MSLPAPARPDTPARPPSASRGQRRPFVPASPSSPYQLPAAVRDRLGRDLGGFRNRDAAMALAVFLGRFWTAPGRVALAFPVDRRALARHAALGLTEDRVRGALATLERVGFIVREVAAPGRRYQRTADGLRRRPLAFRFGAEAMGDFLAANAMRKAARARRAVTRGGVPVQPRYLAAPAQPRPSLALPAAPPRLAPSSPRDVSFRKTLILGDQRSQAPAWTPRPVPIAPGADLAAAIDRLTAARRGFAHVRKNEPKVQR